MGRLWEIAARPVESRARQVDSAHVGAPQVGVAQIGAAQVEASRARDALVRPSTNVSIARALDAAHARERGAVVDGACSLDEPMMSVNE